MNKISLGIVAISSSIIVGCHSSKPTAGVSQIDDKGINHSYMDTGVRPQDDFFSYVNGNWYKTTEIPSDKASWGAFNELREMTDDASLGILHNLRNETYEKGSEGQKIQDLYAVFTDWESRNKLGIMPLQADIDEINRIQNLTGLHQYLTKVTPERGNAFYAWNVGPDMKNSTTNAVYLSSPSLGLGRDYYQKVNEANTQTLEKYTEYIAGLLQAIQYPDATIAAKQIVDFEKAMAKTLLTLEENRNANLRYNPKNMDELSQLTTAANLPEYLQTLGVNTDKVIIGEINYYTQLEQFINEQNLPLIKAYLTFHLTNRKADQLNQQLNDLKFDFYAKYLQGQKEQRPMDKQGLQLINSVLGEAFGKLYVEKYFPAEAKSQMQTYISYLKKAFDLRISQLDWMSDETKVKAREKLSKFGVKIAYPDKWRDYTALQIKSASDGGSLYSNLQEVTRWHYQRNLDKVGKPVDKSEWGMSPQTVNAYYSGTNNEIVFPAAILQPPFFNFEADPAVNFGGIGAVIGHEISHGFDDSGSRFDGDGNLNNWWTDADRKNFDEKVGRLAAQFDQYEPVKGSFINGKFTSGENIGDLGGVAVAFEALQMYLNDHPSNEEINGFTQEQRFFMSWATVWRTKSTEQYLQNQIKTDPHSPGYYRAFAPLLNIDAFHEAFQTQPGDKMYKAPSERINIW
ncbi:MAG: M13 family metallopeptidase [Capnocytophaga sp.]|nr:M13 family metallopeptidase [Capnocytophaga sp.]